MRCPVCRGRLEEAADGLRCSGCGAVFPVEDGIPRMLDDRLPGIAEKRGEIEGWVAMAKRAGLVRARRRDRRAPPVPDPRPAAGTTRPGARTSTRSRCCSSGTCGRGCACSRSARRRAGPRSTSSRAACEYVATDILADPNIGIGRGAFFEARVGPFARVQADGEHLPFADGVVRPRRTASRRCTTRSTSRGWSREMARVTRRGGMVCGAERGDARGRRERRGRGPGRGEGARDQRARAHALRVPVGVLRAPGSSCAASSTRRATTTCAGGGSAASCGGSRASAARRRRGSRRPATATRA